MIKSIDQLFPAPERAHFRNALYRGRGNRFVCPAYPTTLTVWTPPKHLRQQIQEGEIEPKTRDGRDRGKKRLLEISEVDRDAERVRALYENRFDDLSPIPGERLIVELGDTFVIKTGQDRRGASIS